MQQHPLPSGRYRARFIGILLLVCFLNLADRTVFSLMVPMIRVALQLSDTRIDMLQGLAFALLYGGLGIPVGWPAERYCRVRIIAIATAFWSAATALSGMATSFGSMLLTRIGVGTGEAGFTAPTSSLVADHFPRERRASGMSLIMLGLPIGAMVAAQHGSASPNRSVALPMVRARSALAAQSVASGVSFDVDTSPGAAASAKALESFRGYIDAFNRSDFDGFSRFYLPDIDFRGRGGTFAGRDAVLAFYRGVKAQMRETLTIRGLVVGRHQWVADVVTELYAQEDWPDFPTGAKKKGETRRSENFIWYELAGDKFKRVRSGRHSGNPAPTSPQLPVVVADQAQPAFGAAEFAAYMDAFNRDDYASFGDHYTDDVRLVIAGDRALSGRQAIFDFYKTVKSPTRRTIQINRLVTTPGLFAAELQSEFLALEDLPNFVAGPMKKGGRIFINTFVIYELKGGKFSRIRPAEYRKEKRGVA